MLDHLYIPKKNMMVLFWAMETDFTSMSGGRMKEVWKHILMSVWEWDVLFKDAEAVDIDCFGALLMENLRTPLRS